MRERLERLCLVAVAVAVIAPSLAPQAVLALPGCCFRTFETGTNCIVSQETSQAACESMRIEIAFRKLLERFPHLALATEAPEFRANPVLRGLVSLPVSL